MDTVGTNQIKTSSLAFFSLVKNPVKFKVFLLKNLPAAYFSGVKINSVTEEKTVVSVPYKWFTRNPFRCTYFACLSMAAEMSTGLLAMSKTYRRSPKISMIVTGIQGEFYKRATGLTRFICEEGNSIKEAIQTAIDADKPQSIKVLSSGFNERNELIAEFWVTWSFKLK